MKQVSNLPHPGLRARDLRKKQGKTLDQIADASDLSKGHLSRFERGEKALSVASLLRLASALEVSVGMLVGEELSSDDIHIVRAGDRPGQVNTDDGGNYVFYPIGGTLDTSGHTTFLLEIKEKYQHHADAFHGGRELMYVLQGTVVIKIGNQAYSISQGDYLEFPGHMPHVLESTQGTAKVLLIVVAISH